jgi:putative membrane protein
MPRRLSRGFFLPARDGVRVIPARIELFAFAQCGVKGVRSRVLAHGYTPAMLWVKSFHIVFVASWFAGLFYLPRIFVNLAMVPAGSVAERERLLLMAGKLLRFTTILAVPAIGLGLWLWLGYGIGRGAGNGWMHAKLAVVLLVVGYHHACAVLLRTLRRGGTSRSHRWFRWFNEVPVLLLVAAVVLVVVKPF